MIGIADDQKQAIGTNGFHQRSHLVGGDVQLDAFPGSPSPYVGIDSGSRFASM